MSELLEKLRAAITKQGNKRDRAPYTVEVQRLVAEFAREQRSMGTGWRELSAAAGMSVTTIRRYLDRHGASTTSLLPVALVAEPPTRAVAALVLISPSGFRLEGLDIDAAAKLMATLR